MGIDIFIVLNSKLTSFISINTRNVIFMKSLLFKNILIESVGFVCNDETGYLNLIEMIDSKFINLTCLGKLFDFKAINITLKRIFFKDLY